MKKITKWEKKITDYLAKAESDTLEGITGGFETGIPAEVAVKELVYLDSEQPVMGGELDKSKELFDSDNESEPVFQLDMDTAYSQ